MSCGQSSGHNIAGRSWQPTVFAGTSSSSFVFLSFCPSHGVACKVSLCLSMAASKRSPASKRRNALRRSAWHSARQDQHARSPVDRIWLLRKLCLLTAACHGRFATYLAGWPDHTSSVKGCHRELFPLPPLQGDSLRPVGMKVWRWRIMQQFVNHVLAALNFLHGPSAVGCSRMPSASQASAMTNILRRALCWLHKLESVENGTWEHLMPDWAMEASKAVGAAQELVADKVDCLSHAGLCDPTPCLDATLRETISDPRHLFPHVQSDISCYESFTGSREEYAKLVVKQLRSGKLGLAGFVQGGGTVFAVGKSGSARQREVWHGQRVSQAAVPPPCPRHLASPVAFAHMEASAAMPIRVSKRDAKCWFDQLSLPPALRLFMGRPPISVIELQQLGGLTTLEVQSFLEAGHAVPQNGVVYPVSRVWPMGFCWSSFIAQEQLLAVCKDAGLSTAEVLAGDAPIPASLGLAFAAATDDVMVFSNAGVGITSATASALDAAMDARGIVRNKAKDVDDELCATCQGVELEDGLAWAVPAARVMSIVCTLLNLAEKSWASPKQVQQFHGTLQWYDLLCRPKSSVYQAVYEFVRLPNEHQRRCLPHNVLEELLLSVLLGVFWKVDLTKRFLPLVAASDANTDFGFGASICRLPIKQVRDIARVADKQGDYVVLAGSSSLTGKLRRLGVAHSLKLQQSDFVHVLSVRKRFAGHINILEGWAFFATVALGSTCMLQTQ